MTQLIRPEVKACHRFVHGIGAEGYDILASSFSVQDAKRVWELASINPGFPGNVNAYRGCYVVVPVVDDKSVLLTRHRRSLKSEQGRSHYVVSFGVLVDTQAFVQTGANFQYLRSYLIRGDLDAENDDRTDNRRRQLEELPLEVPGTHLMNKWPSIM